MTGLRRSEQLALALDYVERFGREDFLESPCNLAALSLIDRWPDWPDRVIMLVGPQGTGKSHLASIWAAVSQARRVAAAALLVAELPSLLGSGALVIEDAAAECIDELTLFHFLNLAREDGAFVLFTARTAPAGWPVTLKDLASRLRAIPVIPLQPPDDALLRSVIVKLCVDRQLAVDDGLVSYIATHIERSVAAARAAVEVLDREALRQQRPVTRALAADLFRAAGQYDLFGGAEDIDPV